MPLDGFLFRCCAAVVASVSAWIIPDSGRRGFKWRGRVENYFGFGSNSAVASEVKLGKQVREIFSAGQRLEWMVILDPRVSDHCTLTVVDMDYREWVESCRAVCILLLSKRTLPSLPRDMRVMLAELVWATRADEVEWGTVKSQMRLEAHVEGKFPDLINGAKRIKRIV